MAVRPGLPVGIALVLGLLLAGLPSAGPAAATVSTTLNVTTTADSNPASGPCSIGSTTPPYPLSLRNAVCVANNLGGAATINVPAGTYDLSYGELQPGLNSGQDVTIAGAGAATTIIDAQGQSRVLNVDANLVGGVTAAVQGVTITGGADSTFGGAGIIAGSGNASQTDSLSIASSVITGNHANGAAPTQTNNPGGGIQFIGGALTITNSTISDNSAASSPGAAVFYEAQGQGTPESFSMSGSTISGNTSVNTTGSSVPTDGAVDLAAPSGSTHMAVSTSTFTGNALTGTSGPVRGAALTLEGGAATVTGSSFSGNDVSGSGAGTGSGGGAIAVVTGSATIENDRITGNQATSPAVGAGIYNDAGTVNATDDWWGCNAGPGSTGCDSVSGTVTTSPRLELSAAAVNLTSSSGTAQVTADVDHNSAGTDLGAVESGLNGVTETFSAPEPSGTACTPGSVTFSGGTAAGSCTFAADGEDGAGQVVVTVDNQSITVPVTIEERPTITTQPVGVSAGVGGTASFTAAASGYPAPTVQWAVSTDGGSTYTSIPGATSTTLGFTVTAADNGNMYEAVFTNGAGTATTTPATLTVSQAPAITSAGSTTFTVGTSGSFTITTTGYPAATVSESGALPSGVTLTSNGDGTATLAGTPAAGTGGTYPITVQASNGVTPAASQSFTLTVGQAPVITSANSTAFGSGTTGTFTVATSGYPTAALTESGSLPSGVTFTDNGDGTATLTGTATNAGTYPLSITAKNSAGQTTQAFTLTVNAVPQVITFTSTPPATPVVGESYPVTATGGPSGQPVTFTIDPASTTVCTIGGSTVTFTNPGACIVDAAQAGDSQYAAAAKSQTVPVSQASTTTAVTVQSGTLTAAVAPVAPGAGTPTGSVTFSVDGQPVGTAGLSSGTATLTYTVPSGMTQAISAVYGGDTDFTGSSGSTSRQDPSITATVSSSIPETSYGWYRSAVTVTFNCTTHGAPLTAPCPAPVTLTGSGAGQSVTRTITATDGGAATATASGINIDTTPPSVSITGVQNGATYFGSAPTAVCDGTDALSGIASCTLSSSANGAVVTVTAKATDRAGNVSTASVTYDVLDFYILGASYQNHAFQLQEGQAYTIVALTSTNTRPQLYAPVPAGTTPTTPGNYLQAAGQQSGLYQFTLNVCISQELASHPTWNFGVKVGSIMNLIEFQPVPGRNGCPVVGVPQG